MKLLQGDYVANFMILQNAAILNGLCTEPPRDPPGIYENGKGQTICVDLDGSHHIAHSENDLNGWTI